MFKCVKQLKSLTLFEEVWWLMLNITRARKGRGRINVNQSLALAHPRCKPNRKFNWMSSNSRQNIKFTRHFGLSLGKTVWIVVNIKFFFTLYNSTSFNLQLFIFNISAFNASVDEILAFIDVKHCLIIFCVQIVSQQYDSLLRYIMFRNYGDISSLLF